MEKYISKIRFATTLILNRFVMKLMQRPDYYPIRYNKRIRRSKYELYTH